MKQIQKTINEIAEQIRAEIRESIISGETTAAITYDTENGWIDVSTNIYDEKIVVVCHDDDECENHKTNRLEDAIEAAIPSWDSVEDDYEDEKRELEDIEATNRSLESQFAVASW